MSVFLHFFITLWVLIPYTPPRIFSLNTAILQIRRFRLINTANRTYKDTTLKWQICCLKYANTINHTVNYLPWWHSGIYSVGNGDWGCERADLGRGSGDWMDCISSCPCGQKCTLQKLAFPISIIEVQWVKIYRGYIAYRTKNKKYIAVPKNL